METHAALEDIAKKPIRFIAIIFSIVKLVSYAALEFPDFYLTVYRIWVSIVMILLVFALTAAKRLKPRQMAIIVPMSVVVLELSFVLWIGGDRLTYVFLMGIPLLSMLYMDIKAIFIVMLSNIIIVAFILFGLNMQLMGGSFYWIDDYISLIGVGVMYVLYFLLSRYSINAILSARKAAEDATRSKTEFFTKMSHEIRTPISAVLGISEIGFQIPMLPPKAEHSFVKIYNSGKLLLGIINDLMDISKITGGKMRLFEERYEISTLINNAANLHYAYLGNKDIKFRLLIDKNLPTALHGDALRIEQIIINVLSNAFKYTHAGTVELSLAYRPSATEHIELVIAVKDTGLGMTKEQLAQIFNDYTRFHEQGKGGVGGTGLGMSIVAHLVQLMNATIDMQSEPNQGTTVTICVPQKVADAQILGQEEAEKLQNFELHVGQNEIRRKFTPSLMPYGKILVVDDIDINLYVAQGLLAFYDLHVETCTSGLEAVEKVKQGKTYDIIFVDHMMPDMDGIETMQALRQLHYTHPIVILTANVSDGKEDEYLQIGFDGFLSKPILTEKLHALLVEYVQSKQPTEGTEGAEAALPPDSDHTQALDKLRLDFAVSQRTTVKGIKAAIAAGDLKSAHILAHTLKGLSLLIHEQAMSHIAQDIEATLASGVVPTGPKLDVLETELNRILTSIQLPAAANNEEVLALLEQLQPLLESGNNESKKMVGGLKGIPEAAILVYQIERYHFKNAIESLNALRALLLSS